MANETCPHCGSEENSILSGRYFRKYKCDSAQWIDRYTGETRLHQSEDCMRIELANLRSKNRDLQQAYDHVLECEQNRCREVVELHDKLAAVTAERDELRQGYETHEGAQILLANMSMDVVDRIGKERDELRHRLANLQQRFDEAPVWYMENGGFVSGYAASFRSDKHNLTRVRLVADPETPDA